MKEVYLYFRGEATLANDDASADSGVFLLSKLRGMHPTSDTALTLFFEPQIPFLAAAEADQFANADSVILTVGTNDHKDAIADLCRLFAGAANGGIHADGYVDVADDLTAKYAVSTVTAVASINVTAALA
tara:strand:+ start:319 stop:708 length:390 start_codon:yes stop_codon:yes gene_type:complete